MRPPKGEGLMQLFAIGRLYPMRDSNFLASLVGWAERIM